MKHLLPVLTTSFVLFVAPALVAQSTPADKSSAKARAEAKTTDTDVTYGAIKEFTPGQNVVVDIDNAPDKSFDLTDKGLTVKLAKGLKVGDTVKVTEHENLGKTKSVSIAKHSGGGVVHGDKDPAGKKQ